MAGEKHRRQYDEEFKREAVRLTYEPDRTVAVVARDLGMNENNLWRWRKRFGTSEARGDGAGESAEASRAHFALNSDLMRNGNGLAI